MVKISTLDPEFRENRDHYFLGFQYLLTQYLVQGGSSVCAGQEEEERKIIINFGRSTEKHVHTFHNVKSVSTNGK